jgi:predicted MFS family arabinose efflux permease
MGLYTMAGQFAFMTGPWLGVWVLERFGSTVVWAGCLVMALVAAAVMLAARFEDKDEPKRLEQAAG